MKSCAIVAEYNPFHHGHRYQIEETKKKQEIDVMVAVMSGNFVQRGEPACIDKWTRARVALEQGIDLVLELPYSYATQSASKFAQGAIEIAKLAQVDYVSFGSECGNLENLQEIADTPIQPDHLKQSLDTGMSFPRAYSLLTSEMRPNDILAVCYLKELSGSSIKPILIPRTSNYLDETLSSNASAQAIRKALQNKQDVSMATPMAKQLMEHGVVSLAQAYPYFRTLVLTSSQSDLQSRFLFSEGMENLFRKVAKQADTYPEFLQACTNYRYTAGRIRRCMLQVLTQTTTQEVKSLPKMDHIRVLGMNLVGQQYLHELKKYPVLVSSRFADVPKPYREIELRSTYFYTSLVSSTMRETLLQEEIGGALQVQ